MSYINTVAGGWQKTRLLATVGEKDVAEYFTRCVVMHLRCGGIVSDDFYRQHALCSYADIV